MPSAKDTLPRVSVCIANYNGNGLVGACLDSVLMQDCDFPFEVLVHDDASTDSSADLIAECYPSVRLLRSTENVGFCVANNRMAALAQGDYLLLLNNDAMLCPGALRSLLDEALRLGHPAILSLPQYDAASGELIDVGCRLDPFFNPVPNLDRVSGEVGMVIGACLWVDRKLWEELDGFPVWFGSIGEDLYLCCRARMAGYPVRVLGVSGYRHHVGRSFGGGKPQDGRLATTLRRRALSERNKTFVMAVTVPFPLLLLLMPLHLLSLSLEGVVLSILLRQPELLRVIYLPVFAALWQQRAKLREVRSKVKIGRSRSNSNFFSVFDLFPHKFRLLQRHGLPAIRK